MFLGLVFGYLDLFGIWSLVLGIWDLRLTVGPVGLKMRFRMVSPIISDNKAIKHSLPLAVSHPRPGDRVIRVSRRRRNKLANFFDSIAAMFRFGGSPGAR